MELKELTNEEFNSFIEKYELNSMYQTTEYALTMNNQNYEPIFVGLYDDSNELKAASLLLIEKLGQFKYAYAPRGFLIDYSDIELLTEFTKQIKQFLKEMKVIAVKISPLLAKSKYNPITKISINNPNYEDCFQNLKKLKYYHLGFNNFFESYKPRFVALATLEKDTKEMFNKLDEDLRNKIISCDLAGVRIYKGTEQNLDFVYDELREKKSSSMDYVKDLYTNFSKTNKIEVFFAQLETKVFLVNTQIEYQKQVDVCSKITDDLFNNQGESNNNLINIKIKEDNKLANLKNQLVYATNILREHPNGIILACVMAIRHRDKIYLTLDGINDEFKNLCPKHLLIWKLMEKYALEGYTDLYIGGITNPTFEGENKYKDETDFRLSFNAEAIEYAGDFELVTHYTFYTLYRNAAPFRKIVKKQEK